MEAMRQVYEKLPDVISIPPELRDRRVEVILQPLKNEPTPAELAAELGMKPEDVLDPHALRFAGCMPDLPARAPQDDFEQWEELDWQ